MSLEIKNLKVNIDDIEILKGINLEIKPGETHVLMGRNGSGKSTLGKTICGYKDYKISNGTISYNDNKLNELSIDDRSHLGIFMSNQNPIEINGLSYSNFFKVLINEKYRRMNIEPPEMIATIKLIREYCHRLGLFDKFEKRYVNVGLSGGEKKKSEILQMMLLNPSFCIFDEIDSGVDVDAIKEITKVMNEFKTADKSYLIVTHYTTILNYLPVDYVHVVDNGQIVKTGTKELAYYIEENGYNA